MPKAYFSLHRLYRLFCLGLIIGCLSGTIPCALASPAPGRHSDLPRSSLPDSPPDWFTIGTPHFLIYYTAKDKYFSQELTALAEKSYTMVTDHLDLHPTKKITLYLASSRDMFTQLQPSPSAVSKQAIGLAYPGLSRILLLSPRAASAGSIQLEKTFIHELTHIILGSASFSKPSVSIPQWFNEGLSMHVAEEWNWHYEALMTRICITRALIPLHQLENSFPTDPDQLQTAYAQSVSMISYIFDKYGQNSLRKITRLLIQGDTIDEALSKVIGMDLDELEIRWRKHNLRLYTWVPILTSSVVLWFIISLIFLLVYYRKRRMSLAKVSEWEEDDIEEWLRKQLNDLDEL